jgi:hypothetical protein
VVRNACKHARRDKNSIKKHAPDMLIRISHA